MLYTISSRYILILSYHLRHVLTTKIFSRGFPIKILYFSWGELFCLGYWGSSFIRIVNYLKVLEIIKRQRSSLETYYVYLELGSEFLSIIYMKVMLSNVQPCICTLFYLLVGW